MILQIFTEIGSYSTDMEQKVCWHSFFWDGEFTEWPNIKWTLG